MQVTLLFMQVRHNRHGAVESTAICCKYLI
jgi:hypothetical protein